MLGCHMSQGCHTEEACCILPGHKHRCKHAAHLNHKDNTDSKAHHNHNLSELDNTHLRGCVICGGGFQAAHKRAMAQLCLSVRAYDLQVHAAGHPIRLLLSTALGANAGDEHLQVGGGQLGQESIMAWQRQELRRQAQLAAQ